MVVVVEEEGDDAEEAEVMKEVARTVAVAATAATWVEQGILFAYCGKTC